MKGLLQLICYGILTTITFNNNAFSTSNISEQKNNNEIIMQCQDIIPFVLKFLEMTESIIIDHNDINEALKVSHQSRFELLNVYNFYKFMYNRENKCNIIKKFLLENNVNIDNTKSLQNIFNELYCIQLNKTDDINKANLILDCTKKINTELKRDMNRTLNSIENIITKDKINKVSRDLKFLNNIIYRLKGDIKYICSGYYLISHFRIINDEQATKLQKKLLDILGIALNYLKT